MRIHTIGLLLSSLTLAAMFAAACNDDTDNEVVKPGAAHRWIKQIQPPLDVKTPPEDAARTASGLVYKKLIGKEAGAQPRRGDTALVHYTGWRQQTGETFFTTRDRGQPMALDVAHAAPGFGEALALLRKGEKAMLWVQPGQGVAETLVYEIEVVEVVPPAVVASGTTKAAASLPPTSE